MERDTACSVYVNELEKSWVPLVCQCLKNACSRNIKTGRLNDRTKSR